MLTSILKILVKNSVKENFDITFMENKKVVKFFFSFPIKKILIKFLTSALRTLFSISLK